MSIHYGRLSTPGMPVGDLLHFAQLLLAQRTELDIRIREVEAELNDVREARADASADDEHDPEGSTLSSDWSRIHGLGRSMSGHRADIGRALDRLADDRYGNCLRCGKPIGKERLEAWPAADHCISCARELEV